ncbi:MAG: oligosaccharide flippase family protein [Candidatus Riflebacteria bacterium]|nr:oligosaccharide flippase family protein [Candidatus Riflebacteria bacterium]
MNLLKINIAANFVGTLWQALIGLIFVPVYIKFVGVESWGLIGFFATLQVLLSLLDMGLSGTLNRELARLSAIPGKEKEMRDLTRTLEILYWSVAIFVGIVVVSLSPTISKYWIKAGNLPPGSVEQSLLLMGFLLALQMPAGFYSGGLMGLQKQLPLNIIVIGISTLRAVGAIFVLWLLSPTIQAFFRWQIIISSVNTLSLGWFLWYSLPRIEGNSFFQWPLLKGIWKFAAGMSGISIFTIILTQLDKILLSKMLSLEMFGYYMLANVVAMSPTRFFSPVFYSIYPRFTQLSSTGNQSELILLYHKICQFMAVLILPGTIVLALFPFEILLLWTQNSVMAENSYRLVRILVCGTAINGLLNPPYVLQLAFGWTRLSFYKNAIALILFVPCIIYLTRCYGSVGAACVWLALNLGYFLLEIPIMHRRLLPSEKWRWYLHDVSIPLFVSGLVAGAGRVLMPERMSQFMIILYLVVVLSLTLGASILATPMIRELLSDTIRKVSFRRNVVI